MISELRVRDFGIIEEITWRPAAGLNVITGETGAGKSLVVDAVEALLSGQVNEDDIRHGSQEARVEGIFDMPHRHADRLRELLSERGLETEDDTLLIMCDFRRQGRSVPRINSQAVPRSLLREIGAFLVDIHAQSGHLSLFNKDQHLEFLDTYAHTLELRRTFSAKAVELHQVEREIQTLQKAEQDTSRQTELLDFQIDEIQRAELKMGEDEELEKELNLLTSSEKLKAAAYEVHGIIYGDESALASSSAVDRLNEALQAMRRIVENDPSWQPQLDHLEGVQSGLTELARDILSYGEKLHYDPQRLEEVQNRLELIRNLKRKYGGSIGTALDFLIKARSEREALTHSHERLAQLEAEIQKIKEGMGVLASQLSRKRVQAAETLAGAVKKELGDLNMSQVVFEVSVIQEHSENGIPFPDGKRYKYDSEGVDTVEFMASTNPGEPLKPLSKIASTGEISRFLLALKVALAEADTTPVLIFDEIDIGVGGRSGEIIGEKLWKLSRSHQVICVTHLPQIAAFGDAHYSVTKEISGNRTVSTIETLQGDARLSELSVMIGGPRHTANSFNTARELARKAETWKSGSSRDRGIR